MMEEEPPKLEEETEAVSMEEEARKKIQAKADSLLEDLSKEPTTPSSLQNA